MTTGVANRVLTGPSPSVYAGVNFGLVLLLAACGGLVATRWCPIWASLAIGLAGVPFWLFLVHRWVSGLSNRAVFLIWLIGGEFKTAAEAVQAGSHEPGAAEPRSGFKYAAFIVPIRDLALIGATMGLIAFGMRELVAISAVVLGGGGSSSL